MTDQQLRALQRKHLMLIIRDLEKSLEQAAAEREALMLAFQYGYAQGQGMGGQERQHIDAGQPTWQQLPAAEPQYAAREAQVQDVWYPQQAYPQPSWQMYPGP